jgi:mono/diheme cytochrome c family protein
MTLPPAIKRLLWIVLAAIVLVPLLVIGIEMAREPGRDEAGAPAADAAGQVARGAYLARAGNCMGCHTARGGRQYAGGRAIVTPFGSIYSSNITPDDATGIGRWSADDFWRALHNGKSKDGRFLYPAFPYPNYTRVTRADADALYAYLRTLPPVGQANRDHALRFPYNQRVLLAFWRALYFTPGVYRDDAARTPEWNRGAYLVQGLGHCAACHTTRNALGGTVREGDLAGGMIPMLNWYASSLTSDAQTGLGEWRLQDIADLLKTGVSQRGAVFGPMAEVVGGSLQHLSPADIGAMAGYLKSVPRAEAGVPPAAVHVSGDAEAIVKRGARLYEDRCAGCHQADGKGQPPAYPPLAGNRSLAIASAINPIRIVLNGGYPPSTAGNPRPYGMPPSGPALNDDEVAAVVSYIRTAWGNKGTLVSPVEVARFRGVPVE